MTRGPIAMYRPARHGKDAHREVHRKLLRLHVLQHQRQLAHIEMGVLMTRAGVPAALTKQCLGLILSFAAKAAVFSIFDRVCGQCECT
jgi:hypothetical protein